MEFWREFIDSSLNITLLFVNFRVEPLFFLEVLMAVTTVKLISSINVNATLVKY